MSSEMSSGEREYFLRYIDTIREAVDRGDAPQDMPDMLYHSLFHDEEGHSCPACDPYRNDNDPLD